MRGEKVEKIRNIVEGQLDHFRTLYYPIMETTNFKNTLKLAGDGMIMVHYNYEFLIIYQISANS